ncbi:3-keto-disaccharide hydrolase [Planctomicrobium sp. SH661]|uniref:3-keto-disaccharide hydrolase n=1 Tax=Planctomicrobium sp. SH661 TaxID=3448124 RepID=UPI003F5B3C94
MSCVRSKMSVCAFAIAALVVTAAAWAFDEWKSNIAWEEPKVVTPGTGSAPPSDAIVLLDGKHLDAWENVQNWTFQDGYGIAGSAVATKQKFGDCQLHLEFATPEKVSGSGQGRGNNGVYLMGRYELQILDSYENPTYFDGQCGSIYKQHPPLVNACRKPGEWQTYDIFFTAPRFNADGTLESPAAMTVLQNGVLIQNHFQLLGATAWDKAPEYHAHGLRESLQLGYHGNPVRFRNIWIRDLLPAEDQAAAPKS